MLKADTAKDGALHLNGMQFRALVIPYAEALPVALLENVQRYLDAGVKVYFVGVCPFAAVKAVRHRYWNMRSSPRWMRWWRRLRQTVSLRCI